MSGYCGKILRINLTSGTIATEALDLERAKKFIGGRGLASDILAEEIDPNIDALSPENKLIIMTGPLTGAPVPTSARYMVVTKSPLTGTIASSNSGGHWGPELKFAGYDALILEGKAAEPCYLSIQDGAVELKCAKAYWGSRKLVSETTDALVEESGDPKSRVLLIGQAGEQLSPIAAIMNDKYRAAGRSGVGAVMGSKNLKAIVVRGSGKTPVADPEKTKDVVKGLMAKIKENGVTGTGLPAYGTAVLVNIINESGAYPTENFQKSQFATADQASGEALSEKYLTGKDVCYRCPIACGRFCEADGVSGGGPEYETIWAFSANCGIDDLPAVIKANALCNEYGIDTISAGATVACAMELAQRGFIKEDEMDGTPLVFGSSESVVEWTRKMCAGEGLGAKMLQGSYRLANSYGEPDLSMSVKKQELPAYDPRGIQGQGLAYATSNRGGCHVRGYLISPEILGVPEKLDPASIDGKAVWAKAFQDLTASIDSLGLCLFTSFAIDANDYAALYNAVVGTDWVGDDMFATGDRIWNRERLFNLSAGIGTDQDKLPRRLLTEPIIDGPAKGAVNRLSELLPEYYKERGWSPEGIPTAEKLESLGL